MRKTNYFPLYNLVVSLLFIIFVTIKRIKTHISGVYKILNTINQKFYIGSSYSINIRKIQHLNELRKGTHHCKSLQNNYNKYGESSLDFQILEELRFPEDYWNNQRMLLNEHLINREQYYMDTLNPHYNVDRITYPHAISMTQEIKDKIGIANKGKKRTPEMVLNSYRSRHGNRVIDIYKDGVFISACNMQKEASELTGATLSLMDRYLNGKIGKNKNGYSFKYRYL